MNGFRVMKNMDETDLKFSLKNIQMDTATILGMVGVSGILGAYFLNLFNMIDQNSYTYILINLIGATLACISSVMIESIPFTILEGVWALVSMVALVKKIFLQKKT